jgi:hypothetical protein
VLRCSVTIAAAHVTECEARYIARIVVFRWRAQCRVTKPARPMGCVGAASSVPKKTMTHFFKSFGLQPVRDKLLWWGGHQYLTGGPTTN